MLLLMTTMIMEKQMKYYAGLVMQRLIFEGKTKKKDNFFSLCDCSVPVVRTRYVPHYQVHLPTEDSILHKPAARIFHFSS